MADEKVLMTGSVFISYASQDTAIADKVRAALESAGLFGSTGRSTTTPGSNGFAVILF
jgi:hypothetical protein